MEQKENGSTCIEVFKRLQSKERIHFLGKESISILKVELPPTEKHLNRYIYRQINIEAASFHGKTVQIVKLNNASSDGTTLEVEYKFPGTSELKPGILEVATMKILEP